MMRNYVKKTDLQRRAQSTRTYRGILASLSLEVARRYGVTQPARPLVEGQPPATGLDQQLQLAIAAKDWGLVKELTGRLEREQQVQAG